MKFFLVTHKWLGLITSLFIIAFSISGIFLNHRRLISKLDISRSILPKEYNYKNWNNSAVKGSFKLSPDSILLYGGSGIWLTDSLHTDFSEFTKGMKKGTDNRNTVNIVKTDNDDIFTLSTFDLYKLDTEDNVWVNYSSYLDTKERLSDIAVKGDSIVVITRSNAFLSTPPYNNFEKLELQAPIGYKNDLSLFRAMWTLHTGEMYGLIGILIVDFIGIVFIVLSITGIIILFSPKIIKRLKRKENKKKHVSFLKSNFKWHNKFGAWFLILGIIVIVSGIFLRPPALILIVRDKISPLPFSVQDTPNAWFDKLRNIRYDSYLKEWFMYTSDGFYSMEKLTSMPKKIQKAPRVSVMGVTVLEEISPTLWVVGSFNGLYYWDRRSNMSVNIAQMRPLYLDGVRINGNLIEEQYNVIGSIDASGYSKDFPSKEVAFSYSTGALTFGSNEPFAKMPDIVKNIPMSLWHVSLETHVGRIYTFLVGSILGESLFIFISGIIITFIYISGYIVYLKKKRRKK